MILASLNDDCAPMTLVRADAPAISSEDVECFWNELCR